MKTWIEGVLWTISILSLCYSLINAYTINKKLADYGNNQKKFEQELQEQKRLNNLTELEKPDPVPTPTPNPNPDPIKDFMDPRINVGYCWDTNSLVTIEGCEYIKWTVWYNGNRGQDTYLHKSNCRRCWDRTYGMMSSVMDEKLAHMTNNVKTIFVLPDDNFQEETNNIYKVTL